MEKIIAEIEALGPDIFWLVRRHDNGSYFAHINDRRFLATVRTDYLTGQLTHDGHSVKLFSTISPEDALSKALMIWMNTYAN